MTEIYRGGPSQDELMEKYVQACAKGEDELCDDLWTQLKTNGMKIDSEKMDELRKDLDKLIKERHE